MNLLEEGDEHSNPMTDSLRDPAELYIGRNSILLSPNSKDAHFVLGHAESLLSVHRSRDRYLVYFPNKSFSSRFLQIGW